MDLPVVGDEVSRDFQSTLGQVGWVGLAALLLRASRWRRDLHRDRGGLQLDADPAGAPRPHGEEGDALHGGPPVVPRGRDPPVLPVVQGRARSGKTLNAVLFGKVVEDLWQGPAARSSCDRARVGDGLLFVAAQTGIIDGPAGPLQHGAGLLRPPPLRAPLRTVGPQLRSGLHGRHGASDAVHLRRSVQYLVIMYSINVFLTFSLSQFGMSCTGGRTGRRRRSGSSGSP